MPHTVRLALVIVAATAVYLVGIGRVHLFDRDEPRNAQAARQMWQSGDWVVPHYLDLVRTAKPPLTYWCQASAMSLLGDGTGGWGDTAAARLPSTVAIVATLILLGIMLTRWVDRERAFWTIFILATAGIVIGFLAKGSMHDGLLLLWITIAQLCLYAILRGHGSWSVVITMAVAIGLGILTKGPVVIGVMAMTLIVWGILVWWGNRHGPDAHVTGDITRDTGVPPVRKAQTLLKVSVSILIIAAVVTPWVWLVEHRSPGFLYAGVSREIVRRTMEPLEQHKGPPGYYLLTVWATFFPWSVLLPLTFVIAWGHRAKPMIRFALAAAIGPWLMFEIVQTKLPHYLLPAFPALAFLMADAITRCLRSEHGDLTTKGTRAAMCIWGAIVIVVCVAPWSMPMKFDQPLINAMLAFTIVGAIYGPTVAIAFLSRRPRLGLIAMGVGMLPAMAIMWGMYLPNARFIRLSGNLADILKQNGAGPRNTKPGDVQMIGYKEPAVAYHQGGTIREQGDNDFLMKTPPTDWPRFLVIRDDIWQRTPDAVKAKLEEVGGAQGIAYAAGGKTWYVHVVRKK